MNAGRLCLRRRETMTKRLTYGLAVICLLAGYLHAGSGVTAEIPFPFHVGDSILPPGLYTTDRLASGDVLHLRSDDCKTSVLVLSTSVHPSDGPGQPRLVFNRYGNEYFLSQVWTGSGVAGREIRKTRRESQIAADATRNVQTIVARR